MLVVSKRSHVLMGLGFRVVRGGFLKFRGPFGGPESMHRALIATTENAARKGNP